MLFNELRSALCRDQLCPSRDHISLCMVLPAPLHTCEGKRTSELMDSHSNLALTHCRRPRRLALTSATASSKLRLARMHSVRLRLLWLSPAAPRPSHQREHMHEPFRQGRPAYACGHHEVWPSHGAYTITREARRVIHEVYKGPGVHSLRASANAT